jgi:hypothetical protein
MADCINWKEIVNRYERHNVFGSVFFDRFAEYIPASALKGSRLWNALVELRQYLMKLPLSCKTAMFWQFLSLSLHSEKHDNKS